MAIQTKINLEIDQIANIIKSLSNDDIEELEMLLSGEKKEIKKRISEIKEKKVKLLSRKDIFGDI
ncbi:MAG: hypothetical protein AABZ74_14560 [Cyanobacteriota bacterium]